MLRFFKFIGLAVRFAPVVVSVVTLVEGLVSKDTSGADKKALAMATLKDILTIAQIPLRPEVEQFIGQLIDTTVSLLNLLGVFKRKDDVTEAEEKVAVVDAATASKAAAAVTAKVQTKAVDPAEQEAIDKRLKELEEALTR